jgi:MFS family permease
VNKINKNQSLWKQRNFMLLWGGQLTSWLGTEVSGIAMPLVVLSLTGSTAQAGIVAAIRGLVYVVWALPAGTLIDRWNRRTVMVVANLGSGIAMACISVALVKHVLTPNILYIACAIEGSCFVFANLARFTSFRKIVAPEQFASATAQTEMPIAQLVGPPLGGFLYQSAGGFAAFFADSLSYFINAVSVFFITTPLGVETNTERKAMRHEIKEAIVW